VDSNIDGGVWGKNHNLGPGGNQKKRASKERNPEKTSGTTAIELAKKGQQTVKFQTRTDGVGETVGQGEKSPIQLLGGKKPKVNIRKKISLNQ